MNKAGVFLTLYPISFDENSPVPFETEREQIKKGEKANQKIGLFKTFLRD